MTQNIYSDPITILGAISAILGIIDYIYNPNSFIRKQSIKVLKNILSFPERFGFSLVIIFFFVFLFKRDFRSEKALVVNKVSTNIRLRIGLDPFTLPGSTSTDVETRLLAWNSINDPMKLYNFNINQEGYKAWSIENPSISNFGYFEIYPTQNGAFAISGY